MYQTERLILRPWREDDLPSFAQMNADQEVMRYFLKPLTGDESREYFESFRQRMAENGFGFWALEERSSGELAGFVGLNRPGYTLPFSPCVEIGWRLRKTFWGKGYALEAAARALRVGFEEYGLESIVAFTALPNMPSQRVMEKIGMSREGEFDHPMVPENHPLLRHVWYKIRR
ncbi:GNAT family N-acetyltransferase [Cedecea davisae]|uniref:GNAT family N-acetyltransferase n=1 Tax=Cedecea davisae TaxID=158484 RepID=A0ABS6DKD3_9ENTR|nr:GNAT family N-acetyltransferase [Cedecea davisae]MBU4683678.1 GNAT family N-acetyltransferase [Cedecea davisae]MBU4685428.1 GNAT family N-acetyltransferase [Cedecea davisae]